MKGFLKTLAILLLITPSFASATVVGWDLSGGVFQPLQTAWLSIVKAKVFTATSTTATSTFPNATTSRLSISNSLNIFGTIGTALSDFCVSITGGSGLCDGTDASGVGTTGLASTTPFNIGELTYVVNNGTLASVATGTLTETVSGLQFDNTRALVGGSAVLSLTSGFGIPLTASTTEWAHAFASTSLLSGTSPISYVGTTGVISVVADSVGDTQLAFNTGQNLTTASTPQFAGLISTSSSTISALTVTTGTTTFATSTAHYMTTLGVGSDYITDITGAGIVNTGGVLTCATGGTIANGCITPSDWNMFNNRMASTSIDTSAELDTIVTDNTGSAGALVFSVSPTFTGTSTFNALGWVNATSSGSTTLNILNLYGAGNLGTPASLTLTNATGLPVGSITGLGANVATWLATPTTANFASAVTGETGTGNVVFSADATLSGLTTLSNYTASLGTTTNASSTTFFSALGRFTTILGDTATITSALISNGTTTNASSTNFFAVTASSTNLFAKAVTFGTNILALANNIITGLGVWDLGGADSFEIPNASTPTVDATGEIALNTAKNSISIATSTTLAEIPIYLPISFDMSSSSWTGTSTKGFPTTPNFDELVITGICQANSTAKIVVGNGTASSTLVNLTAGTTTVAVNTRFNKNGTMVLFGVGTPGASDMEVRCKFERAYLR